MKILNNFGCRTEPWETPAVLNLVLENFLFTLTGNSRFWRHEFNNKVSGAESFRFINLNKSPFNQTLSNAFWISRSTVTVLFNLLKLLIASVTSRQI